MGMHSSSCILHTVFVAFLTLLCISDSICVNQRCDSEWCTNKAKMEPGKLSALASSPDGVNHMVFVPTDWKPGAEKKPPIIMFLHGGGGVNKDSAVRGISLGNMLAGGKPNPYDDPNLKVDSADENVEFAAAFPFIAILPVSSQRGWQPQFPGLIKLLDMAIKDLNGDPTRVYLTGQSMGGNGAWALGAAYPDRFAAMIPICGGFGEGVSPPDAQFLEALKSMPLWTFHAEDDGMVPCTGTDVTVEALKVTGS